MREDLDRLLSPGFREHDAYKVFLRDHGQALVEALADAARGEWMLRNASWMRYEDFTAMYVELPMDVHLHSYGLRREAIDLARTKASAGGGV
jgi:hypothetical protein